MLNAAKPHYIVDGRSLCGRWMYLGQDLNKSIGPYTPTHACKKCAREAGKRHPEFVAHPPGSSGEVSPSPRR